MYILKTLFKRKNKPFFGKTANEKFEKIFNIDSINSHKNKVSKIIGISQEISDGKAMIVSVIYIDNSYKHITKEENITELNITDKSLLKNKDDAFKVVEQNINLIKEYDKRNDTFLTERSIRITFLTGEGNFCFKGQFSDLDSELYLRKISLMFNNILLSFDERAQKINRKLARQFTK